MSETGFRSWLCASENGIEVGTRFAEPVKYIMADKMVIRDNPLPPMPHRRR